MYCSISVILYFAILFFLYPTLLFKIIIHAAIEHESNCSENLIMPLKRQILALFCNKILLLCRLKVFLFISKIVSNYQSSDCHYFYEREKTNNDFRGLSLSQKNLLIYNTYICIKMRTEISIFNLCLF